MAFEKSPLPPPSVVFDDDNPEWTDADFARARPAADVLPPQVLAAFGKRRGRPPGTDKERVTLRVDKDVVARWKASGAGWQSRMNVTLGLAIDSRHVMVDAARGQGAGARIHQIAA